MSNKSSIRRYEVINHLKNWGQKVKLQRNFLRFLAISKDGTLSVAQKIEKLTELSLKVPFKASFV